MNQGRIWCVVNPSVGLPLFLGGVAVISLIVHASVMTQTTWMTQFFQGGQKAKVAQVDTPQPLTTQTAGAPGFALSVTPVSTASGSGATSFVVTVAPTAGADPSLHTTALVADAGTATPATR